MTFFYIPFYTDELIHFIVNGIHMFSTDASHFNKIWKIELDTIRVETDVAHCYVWPSLSERKQHRCTTNVTVE